MAEKRKRWSDQYAPPGYITCAQAERDLGANRNRFETWTTKRKVDYIKIGNVKYISPEEYQRVKNNPREFVLNPPKRADSTVVSAAVRRYRLVAREKRRQERIAAAKWASYEGGDNRGDKSQETSTLPPLQRSDSAYGAAQL